jgi:hypothetical protein
VELAGAVSVDDLEIDEPSLLRSSFVLDAVVRDLLRRRIARHAPAGGPRRAERPPAAARVRPGAASGTFTTCSPRPPTVAAC